MKKTAVFLMMSVLCICLTGCFQLPPEKTAEGTAWSEDWVTVGNVLGVEAPAELTPRENSDVLAANGMYYATWSAGEAEPYVNEDGEDAEIYDAQLYLLLAGYDAAEKAQANMEDWLSMASEHYMIQETSAEMYNGQTFTVITYTLDSETNPYAYGASAFGVYRNYAISVELSCREGYNDDVQALLAAFLQGCHYAAS